MCILIGSNQFPTQCHRFLSLSRLLMSLRPPFLSHRPLLLRRHPLVDPMSCWRIVMTINPMAIIFQLMKILLQFSLMIPSTTKTTSRLLWPLRSTLTGGSSVTMMYIFFRQQTVILLYLLVVILLVSHVTHIYACRMCNTIARCNEYWKVVHY